MTQETNILETQGLIFDYGGTLDTGGCHWGKVLWHAYQQVGVPVTEERFREAYVHGERTLAKNPVIQPDFTFRRTLDEKLRIELDYLGLPDYHDNILERLYSGVCRHTAESRRVLRQLKERVPLVLVSNFYGNIATVLREFGLDGLFSHIVESAVVGVRKPDPQIFRLGVEALGMEAGAVTVVGDSIDKDIIPARKAGCHTVWTRGEQWTDAPVDTSQADLVIDRLDQLLDNNNIKYIKN